jgi:hypothetical protein
MPDSKYDRLLESGETFYCPNGHSQHFTKNETMQKKLNAMANDRDHHKNRADVNFTMFLDESKTASALRGVITRMKNKMFNRCPRCGYER